MGGLPPTTPRRSKMGLLDTRVLTPLCIPVVGSERRNATKTAPGLVLLDWPRSVDQGALTASRLTRARSSRRNEMVDVDRRRPRPGPGQWATTPGVPSSPQHSRGERMAGEQSSARKTRKARARVFAKSSSAQRSCVASTLWLVCATASHESHYCPCENRCTTKQPCRFWRQAKIISHWNAARKK